MKIRQSAFLFVLASTLILPSCGSKQGSSQQKSSEYDPDATGYAYIGEEEVPINFDITVSTDLDELKEIHTEQQKAYLSYDGNYDTIPEDLYPDGSKHISEPLPISLEWDELDDVESYSIYYGKEVDLKDGYEVKGTNEAKLDVYNSYLGINYFRVVAHYSDGSIECSPRYSYEVDSTYPRNLKIDGMTNCRDMGGRSLEDGGHIKQGLIFRTSATNGWGNGRAVVPDNITNDGKEELFNHLGCITEINVNNGGSNSAGTKNFVAANMWYDGGKHHLYRNAEPLKKVFQTLSNEDNYPLFYHCRIGTDRTGLVAIMINGLLGVDENEIYQDYLFSNFGNIQEKRYIGDKAGRDNIMNYINDLKAFPGEKLQNKIYNFLLSIGVSAEELDNVIAILTEGQTAEGNDNGQVSVLADAFTNNGATKQTSANQANPAVYYTLGNGKSISATFDGFQDGEAYLVAYLGKNQNNSTKINACISADFNGDAVAISDDLTFISQGFGTGDGRTYYSPVVLGTVDVIEGENEAIITGIANDLNIGALTLIYA